MSSAVTQVRRIFPFVPSAFDRPSASLPLATRITRDGSDPFATARLLGRPLRFAAPAVGEEGQGAKDLLALRGKGRGGRHSDSMTVGARLGSAPAVDLPDPPAAYRDRKDGKLAKQCFTGPLYVGDPKMSDVNQQELGDCYWLAPLASCAASNPQIIRDMITDNGDGTYDVRFHLKQDDGTFATHVETVDSDLYVDEEGAPVYCRGDAPATPDRMVLWGAVAEKAFAQLKKTYGKVGRGGDEKESLEVITGKDATMRTVGKQSVQDLYDFVRGALDQGLPVCCSTPAGENDDDAFQKLTGGLVLGHVYSIVDAKIGDNGVRYVRLRNPWGAQEVGQDDEDDGCFWIPIKTLQTEYVYRDERGKRQTSTWMEEMSTIQA